MALRYEIVNVLVTDIVPTQGEVGHERHQRAQREQVAAMQGRGGKDPGVKKAKRGEAKRCRKGIANQRKRLSKGCRSRSSSSRSGGRRLSRDVMQLVLVTQYSTR